jgi:hypothetical protein
MQDGPDGDPPRKPGGPKPSCATGKSVGWVERSDTHRASSMGIVAALLNPSYRLRHRPNATLSGGPKPSCAAGKSVGWVERSDTHQASLMGIVARLLNPSYRLRHRPNATLSGGLKPFYAAGNP